MDAPRLAPRAAAHDDLSRELDCVWLEYDLGETAYRLWLVLWRLGLRREKQDLNPMALAAWLRKGKVHAAHAALAELVDAGLLEYEQRISGRFARYVGCVLTDPARVYGPRRQSGYRQDVPLLPAIAAWFAAEQDAADATAQQDAGAGIVRIEAAAADAPPRVPDAAAPDTIATQRAPTAGPSAASRNNRRPPTSGAQIRRAEIGTKFGAPNLGPKSARAQLSNFEGKFIYQPQLSSSRGELSYGEPSERAEIGSKNGAPKSGGGPRPARAEISPAIRAAEMPPAILAALAEANPLESKIAWLRGQVPGLWLEIAEWVVEEVAGLHATPDGAASLFTADELAKIVSRTRGLSARGELRRPPGVYFAGACAQRFAQLGRPWPKFSPTKPGAR